MCDGGYVISHIPGFHYDVLIAGGVADDISFEEDFIKFRQSENEVGAEEFRVYAYDGTVERLPASSHEKHFVFTRKNIGDSETDGITNLHGVLEAHAGKKVMVKMDIEGGEIPWVLSLSDTHMNIMDQIVMEFHFPFGDNETKVFEKLNRTHILVHFHPNNGCDHRIHRGVYIPNVFECTYLHKRHFPDGEAVLNMDYIPNDSVDAKNIWYKEEIYMGHPPFVHFERFVRKL
jgi:hypothetical protein